MFHYKRWNILCDSQHGLRKRCLYEMQLIETIDVVTRHLTVGNQLGVILFGLEKTFDKVPHSRLLYKLLLWFHVCVWGGGGGGEKTELKLSLVIRSSMMSSKVPNSDIKVYCRAFHRSLFSANCSSKHISKACWNVFTHADVSLLYRGGKGTTKTGPPSTVAMRRNGSWAPMPVNVA